MNPKKITVVSIILYCLSGLLGIYSIWSFIHCIGYISNAVASGQLVISGNEYDVVNFYMSSCAQYIVFAVLLAVAGRILQLVNYQVEESKARSISEYLTIKKQEEKAEKEESIEEWFENTK